ncbi:zinc finger protein 253-like isoform X3 [Gopherus flavomarginatus]|uniref:zinc finger protein 253-like isoform X3 n=1 Tax=Gopherus flavomarginatus TaxID=286002 RepID=UPI0021CBB0A7|nr:zinc finger protein 253-like isoform X3 [Gopherus flavomarginatus]XP_050819270.1 zinc finger protein 253-like isoform X3 [Gopherus flavomarginatus]XP_050819271.1 zinc finger protein 253-like isoform X3 [Gopherus flavomarginatus]XP_050819272.1 zinc finger protein 253-like isoform X3 [Gopherus flavomarginatus]
MMEVEVVWESDNDTCDTGEEHSDDSSHSSERVGRKSSLQLEVNLDYSQPCIPGCSPAGPSGRQELPVELQCEDEETYETYYQKQGETTAGVFVTSNTNFDLQCEDEDLEFWSSEEPQRGLSKDDEKIILVDAFDEEDLEPITGEALPYRCKKCDASFQDLGELKEHNQIHLTENSYRCPICSKEFFRAANLRMHKLIHSSDRPHKCLECDKGFIRTADVWRHLRNVHKIERSKGVLGNGMVRSRGSTLHQNKHGGGDSDQQCLENKKPAGEESTPYICPMCGKGFRKPNLLSRHKVIHRQDKPHKCQECGKSFVERLKLKRHQQIHSGERPFYCEECGRTFTQLVTLQCHQRIHTGEKPYSCAYCSRRFTVSATLRKHERTHKVDKL